MSIVDFEKNRAGADRSREARSPTEGAHYEINRGQIGASGTTPGLNLSMVKIAHETRAAGAQLDGDNNRSFVVLTLAQLKDDSRMGDWTKPQHRRDQERFGVSHAQLMAINETRKSASTAASVGARNKTKRENSSDLHEDGMRKITHETIRKKIDEKLRFAMTEIGRLPS